MVQYHVCAYAVRLLPQGAECAQNERTLPYERSMIMARKRSILGTMLVLGGVAAAGYMIYRNRNLIRAFVEELTYTPEEPEYEGVVIDFEPPAEAEEENDIVIDRTADADGKPAADTSAAEG